MFERYAIYITFDGALGAAGAKWLGWDIARGVAVGEARAETKRPRKYGFHATIKAPFQLAGDESALREAFKELCANLAPVTLDGLQVQSIGRFLALTLKGDDTALKSLASTAVRDLDRFRAPLSEDERARRLKGRLNDAQIENVDRWGYPHVMDHFQFHVTLTGPLSDPERERARAEIDRIFTPLLPRSFALTDLTLVGQRKDGFFEQILCLPLSGNKTV